MARSLVSLADMLLALRQSGQADYKRLAPVFGAEWLAPLATQGQIDEQEDDDNSVDDSGGNQVETAAPAPAASSPVYWRVARDTRNPDLREQPPDWLTALPAPDAAVFQPPAGAVAPPSVPLLPMARFARRMREHLALPHCRAALDLPALSRQLACRQALSRLPRLSARRWPGRVNLVVDGGAQLRPLSHDLSGLVQALLKGLGPRAKVFTAAGSPNRLRDAQDLPCTLPADGTPVLIFSDAGALQPGLPGVRQAWLTTAQRLQRGGRRAMVLAPLSLPVLQAHPLPGLDVLLLDGQGDLRRGGAGQLSDLLVEPAAVDVAADPPLPAAVRALRAALAGNSYVLPGLLRRLRLLLSAQGWGGDPGTELAVWQHPSVISNSNACTVAPAHRAEALDDLGRMPAVLASVVALHLAYLAHQPALLRAEYVRHLQPLALPGTALRDQLDQALAAADHLVSQMAASLLRGGPGLPGDLADYMQRFTVRSAALIGGCEVLETAWALAHRQDLVTGKAQVPAGLDMNKLAWLGPVSVPGAGVLLIEGGLAADGTAISRLRLAARAETVRPVLAEHWPDQPYATVAPDLHGAGPQLLASAIGWLRQARLDGVLGRLPRTMVEPWLLALVGLLDGHTQADTELLALELLAHDRWQLDKPGYPSLSRLWPAEAVPLRLATLVWRHLPAAWLQARGLRVPTFDTAVTSLSAHQPVALQGDCGYTVDGGARRLLLQPFTRPSWAQALRFEGPHAMAQAHDGRWLRWVPASELRVRAGEGADRWLLPHGFWWDADEAEHVYYGRGEQFWQPAWAARHGVDEHGYWAEFEIQKQVQRMRFIPPGRFWMGSPLAEEGRFDNETLHPVTITRGCWLADSACTWQLWQAVTGKLPEGQDREHRSLPATNVSHDDITRQFLPQLNRLLPGFEGRLPGEAEWEYAARAGSVTAFAWGDEARTDRMNFDQAKPVLLPVRNFPANAWGLHQMHGNVWEWCADGYRLYPPGEVLDPLAEQAARRVLRGGAWIYEARFCRSALRYAIVPGFRQLNFGFRLARGLPQAGRAEPGERGAPALPAEPAAFAGPGGGPPGPAAQAQQPGLWGRVKQALSGTPPAPPGKKSKK